MFAWLRRTFPTWTHLGESFAFVAACVAGIGGLPWWAGVGLPLLLLTLLSWPRWHQLTSKAWRLDQEWWQLGYHLNSHNLVVVLSAKILQDCVFLALAYAFGQVVARFWLG